MGSSMTITLHWWMIPMVLAIAGVITFVWPSRSGDFGVGAFFQAIAGTALIFMAIAFCLGHWI